MTIVRYFMTIVRYIETIVRFLINIVQYFETIVRCQESFAQFLDLVLISTEKQNTGVEERVDQTGSSKLQDKYPTLNLKALDPEGKSYFKFIFTMTETPSPTDEAFSVQF